VEYNSKNVAAYRARKKLENNYEKKIKIGRPTFFDLCTEIEESVEGVADARRRNKGSVTDTSITKITSIIKEKSTFRESTSIKTHC